MKSFVFVVLFLLCAYTRASIPDYKVSTIAKDVGLSANDFQSCLNKGRVDLNMFLELSNKVFDVEMVDYPPEMVTQLGNVIACIFKIHGVYRDSKLNPNEFLHLINRMKHSREPIPPPIVNIIQKCCAEDKSKSEESVTVFNFIICFKREMINRNAGSI